MHDKLQSETQYLIAFYVIMLIIGAALGFFAEKYFNGYGIYGTALWFGILGGAGFALFWIPTIIIAMRGLMEVISPYFK